MSQSERQVRHHALWSAPVSVCQMCGHPGVVSLPAFAALCIRSALHHLCRSSHLARCGKNLLYLILAASDTFSSAAAINCSGGSHPPSTLLPVWAVHIPDTLILMHKRCSPLVSFSNIVCHRHSDFHLL